MTQESEQPRRGPTQAVSATDSYSDGGYWSTEHADWLNTKPTKHVDILPGLLAAVDAVGKEHIRIADIGTGNAWVFMEALSLIRAARPQCNLIPTGFEVAPDGVASARARFPDLDLRERLFTDREGPFDIVMLIDVLEHLENPWDMLRQCRAAGGYLVVRQPLIASWSTFRNNQYENQRRALGHIALFDYRQFLDMTKATGWAPVATELLPVWEWPMNKGMKASLWKKLLVKWNREFASFVLSGFYLNGAFKRA